MRARLRLLLTALIVAIFVLVAYDVVVLRSDAGSVGTAGQRLLRSWEIRITIQYVPGLRPDPSAVAAYAFFVQNYTRAAVTVAETPLAGPTEPQTEDGALALAVSLRPSGSSLFVSDIYILIVNGVAPAIGNRTFEAGAAYEATGFVVFGNLVTQYGGAAGEAEVFAHETGHLLGACGLTAPDIYNICNGGGHATDPDSLMAAVLNPNSSWVRTLTLEPLEVAELQAYAG